MRSRLPLALPMLMIALSIPAVAARADHPLAGANALYRDGDFVAAAAAYRQALNLGHDGATVHYNLANALYRSDRRGEAIAHYLAAATLAPRDDDIRVNLDRALTGRPAGPPVPPASWLHATTARMLGTFTLSEFAIAAALSYWIALGCAICVLLEVGKRRRFRRIAIAAGTLALILTALALGRWWTHHRVDRAVVAVESAQVRTGPGESFEVTRSVGEGSMLRIVRADTRWTEVIDESDARGWLPDDALARVTVRPSDDAP